MKYGLYASILYSDSAVMAYYIKDESIPDDKTTYNDTCVYRTPYDDTRHIKIFDSPFTYRPEIKNSTLLASADTLEDLKYSVPWLFI